MTCVYEPSLVIVMEHFICNLFLDVATERQGTPSSFSDDDMQLQSGISQPTSTTQQSTMYNFVQHFMRSGVCKQHILGTSTQVPHC